MAGGWGGSRPNSGPKRKTRKQRWLGGNAGKRPLALVTSSVPVEAGSPVASDEDIPPMLTEGERAYWRLWAPEAEARGLLHQGTVPGFVLLCQWARKADLFWACIEERGIEQEKVTIDGAGQEHREYKANSLLSRWSDAMKRVEQLQARYGLAADGKSAVEPPSKDAERERLAAILSVR